MEVPVEIAEPDTLDVNDEQWFQGLSWSSRIQGYLLFTALGFFSSAMGWVALGIGYYWKYSVLSTLGSAMSLASTLIIMGPHAQLQYMCDEYRRTSSMLYIGSLLLTFVVAFTLKSAVLCLICGLLQYACLIWYSLSYVPYGREAVLTFVARFFP
ncbi:SFT2 domain containing 2 [Trypanosoma grayi]|uniref:SFT2 domain containing 2 n=1 Tax=Trypanosoma grayi TaxID=71804 RepID=UPI0004F49AFA|nr:SFT2 domain containing 2 [Trypanosoma grayi]KEG12559.1 SFT2 domain containing 2 [Trypanosoma grayi]